MIIERTFDQDLINHVLGHESVKPFVNDDFSKIDSYPVVDGIYYLAAWENGTIAGMFVVFPLNGATVDAHSSILPGFYGKESIEAGKKAIDWVFNNTSTLKINGTTPIYNKKALKFSESIGFEREGINKKSFMKGGTLYDQIYFGLEREKWQLAQQ